MGEPIGIASCRLGVSGRRDELQRVFLFGACTTGALSGAIHAKINGMLKSLSFQSGPCSTFKPSQATPITVLTGTLRTPGT